jgi:hypothetical protein
MGDILTLDELRNATPGQVFTERRYFEGEVTVMDGHATLDQLREYRSATDRELSLAVLEADAFSPGVPWWESRIRALERQGEALWA